MAPPKPQPIENAYAYCPRCGATNPEPGSIPFRCKDCDFTLYFGPVAAVGGLILDEEGRLLVVRRARDPGKHKWGFPGGFIDRGETAEQALAREIAEETQLVLRHGELMLTGPNRYTYSGVTADTIDLFYLCRVESAANVVLAESELSEFRWCIPGPEIIENMAFESNRIAIEYWLSHR